MKSFVNSIIIILSFLCYESLNAREIPDSCTALFFPHIPEQGYFNPDSVLYDTCLCKWYDKFQCQYIYARQWYEIEFFNEDPYNLPEYPHDTIIEKTWQEIDSSYVDLRNMFQNAESIFGSFILRKKFPDEVNPNKPSSRVYLIKFQNYCKIDSIVNFIDTSGTVFNFDYKNSCFKFLSNYQDPSLQEGDLSGNYIADNLNNQEPIYHKLSLNWNLAKVRTQLAWEITKGNTNIVINLHDSWSGKDALGNEIPQVYDIYHGKVAFDEQKVATEDLFLRIRQNGNDSYVTGTIDGNIIYNETFKDGIWMSDESWGTSFPMKFAATHGLGPASAILAKLNDKGMVGVCPNCTGINTNSYDDIMTLDINASDSDQETAGVRDRPHIVNNSFDSPRSIIDVGQSIKEQGITVVQTPVSAITYKFNDFMSDTKVIGVYAIKDGIEITDKDCINWDPRININTGTKFLDGSIVNPELKEFWEEYEPGKWRKTGDLDITYEGKSKWPKSQNKYGKSQYCLLDFVVPHATIRCFSDGLYENVEGETFSVAMTSGIAGLMLSVDSIMGEQRSGGIVVDRVNIHRKVYDIMTFTAEKIPLSNVVHGSENDYIRYLQPPYDEINHEWADPLQRWWSKRAGYGLVNAYRSVAHSIRNKANAVYTSGTLSFITDEGNVNEDGKKLMHMGAYRDVGELVLEMGGDKYPGEPEYDNCHGTTKLNGNNLALNVPNDCILAIDGILKQNQETRHSNKIYTSGNGKILMTGYLDEVELSGLVKTSNVKIFSSDEENSWGRISFIACSTDSPEIYDSLIVNGKSKISFDDGISTLMPGAVIYLKGDNDLVINNGATLYVDYSSKIVHSPNNPRNIIIKPGGTLIVKEGAIAEINCKLIAESNINEPEKSAQFIVEPNVLLRLKEFDFGQGSLFQVQEGSHVSLTERKTNLCKGGFELIGKLINNVRIPAKISGNVCYCVGNETTKVDNSASIRMVGYPDDPQNSGHLKLEYADIDNVSITARNVLVQTINQSKFYADIDIFNYYWLLRIDNTRNWSNSLFYDAFITDCEFEDTKMGKREINNYTEFEIDGLLLTGFHNVNIYGCSFLGLDYSINIDNCLSAEIFNNHFNKCKFGTFNNKSDFNLHDNTFDEAYWGSAYVSAYPGFIINNTYNNNCIANASWESETQLLCNNDYNQFVRGILSMESYYKLGPWYYQDDNNNWITEFYGSNFFTLSDPLPPNFHFQADDHIDIEWNNNGFDYQWIWVIDGKNKFSINSNYHLKVDENNSGQDIIYVRNNDWSPMDISGNCAVRHSDNIYLYHEINLCVSESLAVCGDIEPATSYILPDTCWSYNTYYLGERHVWNDGHWADTTFTSEEWADIIDQAIEILEDSTRMDCKCRFKVFWDLKEAIRLSGDNSETTYQRLQNLFNRIKFWCNNLNYWYHMADLYEYFGKIDSASSIYIDIVTNYPENTIDSIASNWRLLYINAITSDSTFGDLYDSLLNVYHERIVQDMKRFPYPVIYVDTLGDTIHYDPPQDVKWEWENYTSLGQNIPNPFSDETEIPFYLKKPEFVKLAVYDAFGREIAVLVNEYRQPGKHSAIYRSPDLYNGVYFYRLEAGGIIETRKMQLIR